MDAWARSACYPQSTFCPMSNGDATFHHWITRSDFRPCSTRRSRSQAPFYPYARYHDCQPWRGYLRTPPLHFGRKPPQSNWPSATVPVPANGDWLDVRYSKGGISPLPPLYLAAQDHRLPPILHIEEQTTMADCSKGSWGLSVLLRVSSIFTGITTSPRILLRQCPYRYAIRAGRNLPDKEFRYLRTVIVTADIHRGFGSQLRLAANRSP
jgi:hypothetical protein